MEETLNTNGWSKRIMVGNSLILHFRTPGHLTRKMRNKLMKSYDGNKKPPVAPSFNVVHQNIPWYSTPGEVGVYIDKLFNRFRPAIIFFSEIDPDLVEAQTPPDYTFLKGTLGGKDRVRVCANWKFQQWPSSSLAGPSLGSIGSGHGGKIQLHIKEGTSNLFGLRPSSNTGGRSEVKAC